MRAGVQDAPTAEIPDSRSMRLSGPVELFGRVSNLFDARYQDVFGYRTEGRGIYAGVRLTPR